jgi:hypothetical protein
MVSHCKNAAGGQSEWKLDKVGRAGELGTAAAKGAVLRQKTCINSGATFTFKVTSNAPEYSLESEPCNRPAFNQLSWHQYCPWRIILATNALQQHPCRSLTHSQVWLRNACDARAMEAHPVQIVEADEREILRDGQVQFG